MSATPLRREDVDALGDVAVRAARAGADVVARRFGHTVLRSRAKGFGDYVTQVDRESEDVIRDVLARETPDIAVLAEESGGATAPAYWAVDPLDGTRNFMIGLPAVGVSIALVVDGRPDVAAIEAPLLDLSFRATRGGGAWSGDSRLRVSERPASEAIVSTGFPLRDRSYLPRYLPAFRELLDRVEDLRRPGAASLDLSWVACGVFDGFFELHLAVWDVAAGSLLVEEAGGVVSDWDGGAGYLSGDILAGSPATHAVLLDAARRR